MTATDTTLPTVTVSRLPWQSIPQFSSKDVAYATADPRLRDFYKYEVNLPSFEQVFADKAKETQPRATVVKVLQAQYAKLRQIPAVNQEVESLLNENTFTVITAHQPSLFTGHLYYIYKIISTINLARKLNETYPGKHVVPVFITGGEDHDFEEINHLHLFGKTLTWENDETGSVGKMSTRNIPPVLDQLKEILGNSDHAQQIFSLLKEVHTKHKTYADAAVELVHELFGEEGLVVINMSNPSLKAAFKHIIKKEVLEQVSAPLVEATQAQLNEAGFSSQAMTREINFFYLDDQIRERIVHADGVYKVLNTDLSFAPAEMEQLIDNQPEKFSPNVVMRPVYQETILPNLAYIGGGGEIAYWLERKSQFENFGVNFPMLIRRNSVLWMDKGSSKKLDKLGLQLTDLMPEVESVIKAFVKENADEELSLAFAKKEIQAIFDKVVAKTEQVDKTLVKTVKAEAAKNINSLNGLEARLVKAEKQRQEISVNQIRGLKDKLFPDNGLQERYDNFLSIYIKHGPGFFQILLAHLNVLEEGMIVISE